jgi:hypothetical protein
MSIVTEDTEIMTVYSVSSVGSMAIYYRDDIP